MPHLFKACGRHMCKVSVPDGRGSVSICMSGDTAYAAYNAAIAIAKSVEDRNAKRHTSSSDA